METPTFYPSARHELLIPLSPEISHEPTATLDSEAGTQILNLFRDLAKRERRALLTVTHDPKVRAVTHRVLMIREGMFLEPEAGGGVLQ
jgi:ABC-type lipoprotein export system ATPase subunit